MEEKVLKNSKKIIIFIMILALLIRVLFVFGTQILQLQYDVGNPGKILNLEEYELLYKDYDKEPYIGRHINYIMLFYHGLGLPTEIIGQFYHPPLHHFILGNILKFMDNFDVGADIKLEAMQIAPLIYSSVILFVFYKILNELDLTDSQKILPMLLVSFMPLNIFMAGSINNDTLVLMFSVISLLYILKWHKEPTMKNAIWLSIWIGLGLTTKTSILVMMIPTVVLFFKKLVKYVEEDKKVGSLLVQIPVFAIIILTLGFWFQIRNLALGLNSIGIIQPNEELSVANYSLWERFGLTNILSMNKYNIWNYITYSSLNYGLIYNESLIEGIVAFGSLILMIISICYIVSNYKENEENFILAVTYIAWWFGYLYLNLSMPYSCSMSARYMALPFMIGFIMLSKGLHKDKSKFMNCVVYGLSVLIIAFSIVLFAF